MEVTVKVGRENYAFDSALALDISIPVRFDEKGLSAFGSAPPKRQAYTTEGFTGDVKQGGSCNCDMLTFSPHLSGTHTECAGHIIADAMAVCDVIKQSLIPATAVTVTPENKNGDAVIGLDALAAALSGRDGNFLKALVIRTLPNEESKRTRHYSAAPYFLPEAMSHIASLGVEHLVVDLPSIDRLADGGKLSNHHIFWNVQPQSRKLDSKSFPARTITELVYVPDNVADGIYMLDLQVAAIMSDAAPSRPLLYKVEKI